MLLHHDYFDGMNGPVKLRGAWYSMFRSRSYHALVISHVYSAVSTLAFMAIPFYCRGKFHVCRALHSSRGGRSTHGSVHSNGGGGEEALRDLGAGEWISSFNILLARLDVHFLRNVHGGKTSLELLGRCKGRDCFARSWNRQQRKAMALLVLLPKYHGYIAMTLTIPEQSPGDVRSDRGVSPGRQRADLFRMHQSPDHRTSDMSHVSGGVFTNGMKCTRGHRHPTDLRSNILSATCSRAVGQKDDGGRMSRKQYAPYLRTHHHFTLLIDWLPGCLTA